MCRAGMSRAARLLIFVCLLGALGAFAGGATLPAGFQETRLLSGLTHPTNVAGGSRKPIEPLPDLPPGRGGRLSGATLPTSAEGERRCVAA